MAFKCHQQLLWDMKIRACVNATNAMSMSALFRERERKMHIFFSVKPKMPLFLFRFISHLKYQILFSNLKRRTPRPGCAVVLWSELCPRGLLSLTSSCAVSGVVLRREGAEGRTPPEAEQDCTERPIPKTSRLKGLAWKRRRARGRERWGCLVGM